MGDTAMQLTPLPNCFPAPRDPGIGAWDFVS